MHEPVLQQHFAIIFSPHTVALKPCYICKSKYRDLESVTEFYELCCFSCTACTKGTIRLPYLFAFCIIALASVCNSTNGSAVQSDKSNSNISCRSQLLPRRICPLSAILESAMAVSPVQFSISSHTRFRSSVHSIVRHQSSSQLDGSICYEFTDLSKDLVLSADSVYKTCLFALESGRWMCHIWKRDCLQGRSGSLQTVCLSSLQQM